MAELDLLQVIDFVGNNIRRKRAEKMAQQPGFYDPAQLEQTLGQVGANPYAMEALVQGQGLRGGRTQQQLAERELDPGFRPTPMAQFGEGVRQFDEGLVRTDRSLGLQEAGQKQQASQFDRSFGQQGEQFDKSLGQRESEFGRGQKLTREQMAMQASQFGAQLNSGESQFAREQDRLKAQTEGNQTLGWGQLYNDASNYQMGPEETWLQKVSRGRLTGVGLSPMEGEAGPSPSGVDYAGLVAGEQPSTAEDTLGARVARGMTEGIQRAVFPVQGASTNALPVPPRGQPAPLPLPPVSPDFLGIPLRSENTTPISLPSIADVRGKTQAASAGLRDNIQSMLGRGQPAPQQPAVNVDALMELINLIMQKGAVR